MMAEKLKMEKGDENIVTQPIYSTGEQMEIEVIGHIADMVSEYQHITFVDTKKFGKCLLIDGVVQTSETDHAVYDAKMLKKMKESDRKMMILGGGDGYIAEMAVHANHSIEVDVIDLDEMVVEGSKQHLDQKVFDNDRVHLHIGDALQYMRDSTIKYDGIACDLTDAPVGATELAAFEEFFDEVISLANACIKDGGWISVQSGASHVTEQFIDSVTIVENLLKKHFSIVDRDDVLIPSYGETCAFLFGQKK